MAACIAIVLSDAMNHIEPLGIIPLNDDFEGVGMLEQLLRGFLGCCKLEKHIGVSGVVVRGKG